MEGCKNIHSGKHFLFIEETNDEKLLLVIPTGEVKPLNASLFEDLEEVNITDLLNNGLITQQQIDGYKKFVEEDSIRLFKEIVRSVEDAEDVDFICPACGKDTRLGGQCSWCLMREE